MTEMDAIETAIDAMVALEQDDIVGMNAVRAARIAIAALCVLYTDSDVDALSGASAARAELINTVDCIEKLIDEEVVYHAKRG